MNKKQDLPLKDLYEALANHLVGQLQSDECPASVAEVARKFLADNGITADLEDLLSRAAQGEGEGRVLPFSKPREPEEEYG